MVAPDFLSIGHAVKDITTEGWRLGGAVAHAAVQAQRLGLKTAVVTRAADELRVEHELAGIDVVRIPSPTSTTFENRYEKGHRVQRVSEQAPPIGPEHIPFQSRSAALVLIAPVLGEVPLGVARLFTRSFVGFSPQGWLRDVRPDGTVKLRPWSKHGSLKGGSVVVASEEDIEGDDIALKRWTGDVPIIVITEGERGARVYGDGRWRHIAAFPCDSPDPTGAGDVFAAAFMIALHQTRDVIRAAAFASAAAALSIRTPGLASIAGRDEIERLMATHPEVALK